MNPMMLPQAAFAPMQQQQQRSDPFQWGAGGRRMTPDAIEREREIAAAMMGMDYSPIASPWQGLARVAENVTGALRSKSADKSERANMDYSEQILQQLQGDKAGAISAQAMADPYLPPQLQKFAQMQWERANPKPPQPTEMQRNYDWLKIGKPERAEQYLDGIIDPEIIVPMPEGPYVGPRSQLSRTLGEGGGLQSGPVGGAPPTAPPQGGYVDSGSAGQLIKSMGPRGFLQWQQTHGTPVLVRSPEEMASLPAGTAVVSPDGRAGVKK